MGPLTAILIGFAGLAGIFRSQNHIQGSRYQNNTDRACILKSIIENVVRAVKEFRPQEKPRQSLHVHQSMFQHE